MKRCPQCSQIYADDMRFCLSDGTPLISLLEEPDQATVIRSERSPVIRSKAGALWIKVLAGAAVLLFGCVLLIAGAIWFFWPRDRGVVSFNDNVSNLAGLTPTPTQTRPPTPLPTATIAAVNDDRANLRSQQEELDRERKRLEEERRRLEEEKRKATATPKPPPRFTDPGTTRITFRRGSISHTTSSTISRQRSFVLRTLAGQFLSASVRSPDGCVTFSDGGSSAGYSTRLGDSFLYLRNNCSEPSPFTLSVTVR
ncbi:MAG TPA: hypothetical protein PKD26_06810 [Pyrinomonadaceae bacterium]|nr:hypothetical protein [Pyrinomonadaceae bacterium]